jgi:hypothetical protein
MAASNGVAITFLFLYMVCVLANKVFTKKFVEDFMWRKCKTMKRMYEVKDLKQTNS